MTNRRTFLRAGALGMTGAIGWIVIPVSRVFGRTASEADELVTVIEFDDAGKNVGPKQVKKVRKTDSEWKQQLTPAQFEIARKKSTERAFTGQYAESFDKGLYRCICCGNALFSSDTKFDSGTGWPSFWAPIAKENTRTADTRCDASGCAHRSTCI
jgi:peptide-methionine (R)-S-oxide reductase